MALSNAERQRRYRRRKERDAAVTSRNGNGRKGFAQPDMDAVLSLLEALPRIRATPDGTYTFTDRARDFLAVFGTEQGRRVLSQVHQICDPASPLTDADKPGTLAMKAGMRRVMHEIMVCMVAREAVKIERSPE